MVRVSKWDLIFLEEARNLSRRSKDPSTQVGALIVSPDRRKKFSGYNGFPHQMEDKAEWLLNREEKYSRVIHGEMNALILAGADVQGFTLYTWPFMPCSRCFLHQIQAGIAWFVFPKADAEREARWAAEFNKTRQFAAEMGRESSLVEVDCEGKF